MDARELASLGKSVSQRFRAAKEEVDRQSPPQAPASPEPPRSPALPEPPRSPTPEGVTLEGTAVPRVPPPEPQGDQKIESIALELIIPSPYQPRREEITKKDVLELMNSIAAAGQLQPVLLSPADGADAGKFHVHSGHRRCAAVRFLGWPTVRAIVRKELGSKAARKIALADNLGREDLSAYELAMSFKAYCEENRLEHKAAAEDLGIVRRQALRLEIVLKASEPLLGVLRDHPISVRVAEHLARLDARDSKKAVRLAQRFAAGEVTAKDVEATSEAARPSQKGESAVKDVDLKVEKRRVRLTLNLPRAELTGGQRDRVIEALSTVMAHAGIAELVAAEAEPIEVVAMETEEVAK